MFFFFCWLLFSRFFSLHQRIFTSEHEELILKNKAAVVGCCSICFSMSVLYLAAAHLHGSSTARGSLSSPIPAVPSSQCQQMGGHRLLVFAASLGSGALLSCQQLREQQDVCWSSRMCAGQPLAFTRVQLSPLSGSGMCCTAGRVSQAMPSENSPAPSLLCVPRPCF